MAGYVVLIVTAGTVVGTAMVLTICLMACGEISSSISNASQAFDQAVATELEFERVPGPVTVAKRSRFAGVILFLSLLVRRIDGIFISVLVLKKKKVLLGLSVFLVLNWYTTTTSTVGLVPFGNEFGVNSSEIRGQFNFRASFLGFTGPNCSACGFRATGFVFSSSPTISCSQTGSTCNVEVNTQPNTWISSQSMFCCLLLFCLFFVHRKAN